MTDKLQEIFGVTSNGAKNLLKSCKVSLLTFFVNMLPMFLLMFYVQSVLEDNALNLQTLIIAIIAIIAMIYWVMYVDYNATYTTTYQESANIRIDIAESLQALPLSYFSQHDLSDLSQTIMSDVERLEHALSHAISRTIAFVVYFALISVLMLFGSFQLALCILLPLVISSLLIIFSKKIQRDSTKKYWQQLRDNSESFQEAIELQEEIKAYNLSESVADDLYKQMEKSEKIHLNSEIAQGVPMLISTMLVRLTLGIIVFVGSLLYVNNQVSLLYLIGYLLAAIKITDAAEDLYFNISEILYIDSAIDRIKKLRQTPKQTGEKAILKTFDIELENVGFSYKEDQAIIQNVSFTAKQNQVTALVGPSGCGKTTLLRLISRLYDYQEGKILIDGQDIRDISTSSLFDYISIVFQDVTLFNNSIMENIRLGRPSASDEEVKKAAAFANCSEFIDGLPDGYDTLVGENGAKSSGGERQRISIARAILKQAPIIILDEITSSLDIENEKLIQESLSYLLKDKTVVIISHRLKSIETADKIVVFESGKVDGIGTHKELLKKSHVYRKLIETSKQIEKFKYKTNGY